MLRPLLALTVAAAAVLSAASPNLLENSGFEFHGVRGGSPEGWTEVAPPGTSFDVDLKTARSGGASLRMAIPETAPVTWYQSYRAVTPLKRGATYTLSAWVRTESVRDGAGAYIAFGAYDGNGDRIAPFDSPGKATGTQDWQRLAATASIPDGTSELRVIVCVHGHGTAWFDDLQVEEGRVPTDYQPSTPDTERLNRQSLDARRADDWLRALPPRPGSGGRIAIVDLALGPDPQASVVGQAAPAIAPSDPAQIETAMNQAGHAAWRIPPERLANPVYLDPDQIDLLVVPTGDLFPVEAHRALVEYLRRGGALITMGGYAFDRPVIRHEGKWYDPASLPILEAPAVPAFAPGIDGWHPSTNRADKPLLAAVGGPQNTAGIDLSTPALDGWDTVVSPSLETKPAAASWSITRFWAKGGPQTRSCWIEWAETDGSRWHKAVPLTTEWQEYRLPAGGFTYWHDNPSVGRGGSGDRFRPEAAARFQFGIATDVAERGLAHQVAVAGVRLQADPLAQLRVVAPRINTRWARIRDAMWPEPEQIGAFDPGFPLRQVARTRAASGQAVVAPDFAFDGELSGYAATAMLGLNGHGFGPNRARFLPLLECLDTYGRSRGHAGAIIHQFSGTFAGSSWAIFGVANRDLFAAGQPAVASVLLPVITSLLARFYLHETDAAYACYRAGETAVLRTRVSDFGRSDRAGEVRFVISAADSATPAAVLTKSVALKPLETVTVEVSWPLPAAPADLYRASAELWEGGRRVDVEETGFAVWSPEVLKRGPILGKDGTRFLLDGRPQFLMGCQAYWGQNGSVTAHSPLAFDRDFGQMRDYGLRWTRCFIPFKTEADKRMSDAIVQLAQKHGLVLYHTPNLTNSADPAELTTQQATAREIATRYLGVPGLAVDICNEPAFRTDDAGLVKAIGKAGKAVGEWQDADVAAFWRCMAAAQRRWATANCEAIHAGDPTRLAAVGWSQGWAGGDSMKDPILASLDLDFTDRHYYGKTGEFAAELKDVDLRGLGKPLVLGECGAKDHPTYKAADPWGMGDDDSSFDQRFLYLAHHTLGLGGAVLSSWHWRDPMEGIFPCGLVHQTHVPRPTALLFRALAYAFARFRPAAVTPAVYLVLPDAGRNGGHRDEVIRAFHRAANLLVACRVDFALIPDGALSRLPAAARALVYPVPFDPADEVVAQLQALAGRGGAVYVSGDVSFDANRQPTKRDRLQRLCGVTAQGEPLAAPLRLPPVAGPLVPAPGSGLEPGDCRPLLRLALAGAEALATCNGTPVVTRLRVGSGQVWFSADPIELAPEPGAAAAALYRAFLRAAGASLLEAKPATPDLRVFRVPGEDADAWVFHNGGPARTVETADFALDLATDSSGFILVGHDGAWRAVECQGAARRQGQEVVRIDGHAFVLAEDDLDLTRTRRLMVLPLTVGQVSLASSVTTWADAEVGEARTGTWQRLATSTVRLAAGRLEIPIAPSSQREMLRVTAAP